MGLYRFQELLLDVGPDELEARAGLKFLWPSLSWDPASPRDGTCERISICLNAGSAAVIPDEATMTLAADDLCTQQLAELTD